jgi:general stress protein CsbA
VVILAYLFFYYILNFPLQKYITTASTVYAARIEEIYPILGLVAIIFAVWLGVRSVMGATRIDPENFLSISLWSTLVPLLFVIVISVFEAVYSYGPMSLLLTVSGCLFTAIFFFVLTYYFISENRKVKYVAIILGLVVLAGAIYLGYIDYNQAIAVTQTGKLINLTSLPLF